MKEITDADLEQITGGLTPCTEEDIHTVCPIGPKDPFAGGRPEVDAAADDASSGTVDFNRD